MTTEEMRQIIAGGETLHAEFKSATVYPDALAAALVSFLNTEGGVLLLGWTLPALPAHRPAR
jgi:predicted HTH transcriptional regulator